MAGFWKTDLHLGMSFLQAGGEIHFLIGAAADQGRRGVSAHITVFQDLLHKLFAVSVAVMDFGINRVRQSQIDAAALQNDLIKVKDPGFPAPGMDPVKIYFSGMAVQIQGKITEQPDAETTVQIVLQHMVDLIKCIFCGRENGVGIAADGLMAVTGAVGRKNFIYDLVRAGVLVQSDHAVVEFQKEAPAGFGKTVLIGDVVIAELFLFQITMGCQNTLCPVKVLFVTDIEIEIAQFAVFRNRIAVGKLSPFSR